MRNNTNLVVPDPFINQEIGENMRVNTATASWGEDAFYQALESMSPIGATRHIIKLSLLANAIAINDAIDLARIMQANPMVLKECSERLIDRLESLKTLLEDKSIQEDAELRRTIITQALRRAGSRLPDQRFWKTWRRNKEV